MLPTPSGGAINNELEVNAIFLITNVKPELCFSYQQVAMLLSFCFLPSSSSYPDCVIIRGMHPQSFFSS
jgi:hypothetical protein